MLKFAGGAPPASGVPEATGSRQVHSSMTRPHGTASGGRQITSTNPMQNGMAPDFAREATRMTSGQTSAGLMSNSLRRRSKEDGMVTRSKSRMMRK
ncbi:hypothetical protein EB796_003342 [Bugula neritina]|uniref:Uncharacterized protein n=1 Tax=Bugula neritina TaxID=10212 RepID=A0A7J7KLE6_BUGNE|nr:hypothetical protein EB796_003342 [Bugula neritina]